MENEFVGKVALITGGASGIGRASALAFAAKGATVMVSDVNEAGLQETVSLVEAAGGVASYTLTDVTDEAAVKAMVDTCVERYGQLDCAP